MTSRQQERAEVELTQDKYKTTSTERLIVSLITFLKCIIEKYENILLQFWATNI